VPTRRGLEIQVAERTAEILATQNQLKSTLDAIRDPMFEADLDGRVYAYSAPGSSLLPDLQGSPVGSTVQQVLPPEAARVVMEALHTPEPARFCAGGPGSVCRSAQGALVRVVGGTQGGRPPALRRGSCHGRA
jgi:hypothetical protein